MVAILSFIQYFLKEHFVFAMAIYTLIFIAVTALFLKHKVNQRNPARTVHAAPHPAAKPKISFHSNGLIFDGPRELAPDAKELLKAMARTSDVYLVTQVRSDEEEETLLRTLYADSVMREVVKKHVRWRCNGRGRCSARQRME